LSTQSIFERQNSEEEAYRTLSDAINANLRVAMPGIIESFNSKEQTVKVRCAIRERITNEQQEIKFVEIPILLDVPIIMQRAGGFVTTFPISKGDECIVIFSDLCINAWWSLGGVQNIEEYRRHDFSDAFAILGPTSQPKKVSNYSTTNFEIRNENPALAEESKISMSPNGDILIKGRNVTTQEWGP